jgi:hypothetical protein
LELDKKLYDKLNSKNGDYLWEPYLLIIIPWTIAGVESSVNLTNSNIVQLQEKRMKIVGLGRFLKFDFLRYYK